MASAPSPMYQKHSECWVNTGTQEIMVFRPTMEEFSNFTAYIEKVERENAHGASGICKIIPPPEWSPRPSRPGNYIDADEYIIDQPVRERIEGSGLNGTYIKLNKLYRKSMSVAEYRKLATSKEFSNPKTKLSLAELERHYWRNITNGEPVYGADTTGSLTDDEVKEFNMNHLGTILDLLKEKNIRIHGVNTVFLYFGMWKTTFPWHAEDMDLYSINYLHFGEPKFWYAIPPQFAEKFERLASQMFASEGSQHCKAFLRHKVYIISPTILRQNAIPFGTMVQYPNEFIVTFPKGYHMGFNTGYNCAESTNFAVERWIDFGKNCLLCPCREDGVEIDMRPFMQKYRPEEFDRWNKYWYEERRSIVDDEKKGKKRQKAKTSKKARRKVNAPSSHSPKDAIYEERERQIKKAKKLVKPLWANLPVDFVAEQEYNRKMGLKYPHCTVCQYFLPSRLWSGELPDNRKEASSLPERSRRHVTNQLFHREADISEQSKIDSSVQTEFNLEEADELLECISCKVVVHRGCYSTRGAQSCDGWRCDRCFQRDDSAIYNTACLLCELRGGAQIETHEASYISDSFVHVICAIANPRTLFTEPDQRRKPLCSAPERLLPPILSENEVLTDSGTEAVGSPSNHPPSSPVSTLTNSSGNGKAPLSRKRSSKFECEICENHSDNLVQCHVCVANDEEGACLYYHATCASVAGMNFERRQHPANVIGICSFHNSAVPEYDTTVSLNDRVVVKLENEMDSEDEEKREDGESTELVVRQGRVVDISENIYCTVDFFDGSTSNDVEPSNVLHCECRYLGCNGTHISGSLVQVDWTDGRVYDAYYRGKATIMRYKVELDSICADNSKRTVEVDRDSIFLQSNPLPGDIRNSMLKRKLNS